MATFPLRLARAASLAAAMVLPLLAASADPIGAATADLLLSQVGDADGAQLGLFVTAAGDLNGDGHQDFAVGAPFAFNASGKASGQVWIYFGGPGLDATPDLVLSGEATSDQFGNAVRGCGDVNGDGWDDLVVGAPMNDAGADNAGRAYVFFGGTSLDAAPDLVLTGENSQDQFGWCLAGPGDLNGDGADIAVGAPNAAGSQGRVYVFFGGTGLDASADVVIQGSSSAYLGWFLNAGGDFDGDGWPDLLVGANTDQNAYLYRGGTGFDNVADVVFSGDATSSRFGYCVASAGDVNNDGWDDVIIGDMMNSAGGFHAGRAFVYFGGPGADGLPEIVYTGNFEYGIFGREVAGAGDLNGDGYDDVVISAPSPDVAGHGPGKAFVFFGGDPPGTSRSDADADIQLTGEAESDRLGAHVAILPDQDGDGRADFLLGANFYDAPGHTDTGKFYLYGIHAQLPVARADSASTVQDSTVVIAVLANDTDAGGILVPASVTIVAGPHHGIAVVDTSSGSIAYTPAAGFAGADTLDYTVADNLSAVSAPARVTIAVHDLSPPGAVDGLAAAPGAGHVAVTWQTVPADADSVEVWRALWRDGLGGSAYPFYASAPGSAPPARPADRAAAAADSLWTRVATLPASTLILDDTLAARGVWSYEAFVRDAAGNWGPRAAAGARATSYRLGDLALPPDGAVDAADAAALAATFGTARGDSAWSPASDIGPTDSGTATGIPLTDGRIDFEDAMVLGMDHDDAAAPPPVAGSAQLEWRRVDETVWALRLTAPVPALKGLRVRVPLDAGVTVSVAAGALLVAQPAPVFLQNLRPDSLDVALVVLGRGRGLDGSGELLRVTLSQFQPLSGALLTARAVDNTSLPAEAQVTTGVPTTPPVLALGQNYPNPFNPSTTLAFSLPRSASVELRVLDVAGRLVTRLLAGETLPAGWHHVQWRGLDNAGREVPSGVYFYRLQAAGETVTGRMLLIK